MSQKTGPDTPITPSAAVVPSLSEAQRAVVDGADLEAAKAIIDALKTRLPALREVATVTRSGVEAAATLSAASESAPESDPRLTRYCEQWGKVPKANQGGLTWGTVKSRLLANDAKGLSLAEGLHEKGILFGVDKDGKLLIADAGEDPMEMLKDKSGKSPLCDKTYAEARAFVMMKDNGKGKQVPTGYELFPYAGGQNGYDKSPEMLAFEAVARDHLFVASPKGEDGRRRDWRGSWLESGESPSLPRYAFFGRYDRRVGVDDVNPESRDPRLVVRRLLRVG